MRQIKCHNMLLLCLTAVAAPTAPSALASDITHNSIKFTWESQNLGDEGAVYKITCSPDCSHDDTSNTHVTITGLKAATGYTLSVVAVINGVSSETSDAGTAITSELISINV